ncbi:MAG: rhodanese-like domain-containing protein [Desulfobacteraceae bacterium]|nr:MAG: rhodanese-like domain-containing protein [Desulfobacteraceae bacterium]
MPLKSYRILKKPGKWKAALVQTAVILAVAAVLGVAVNAARRDGIALVGDWSAESRLSTPSGESLMVTLSDAERMFLDKSAVFMDARSKEEYEAGHIAGAVSLPWQEVQQRFTEVAERIPPDRPVITYCDGESCALSKDLALFLKEMGYAEVHILVNGWTRWKEAVLPVEAG